MAVAEHAVFCVMLFISSALHYGSYTASSDLRRLEDFCRNGILPLIYQGVLDFVQDVCFFEVVHGGPLDITQPYLVFRRTADVDRASEGNVGWFPYNAGDGLVSDIRARDVPKRRHKIDDEVILRLVNAVKVRFSVCQLFSLTDANSATLVVLGANEGADVSAGVVEEHGPDAAEVV